MEMRSVPVFGGCWHVTWDIVGRLCILLTSLTLNNKTILGIVIAIKRWKDENTEFSKIFLSCCASILNQMVLD